MILRIIGAWDFYWNNNRGLDYYSNNNRGRDYYLNNNWVLESYLGFLLASQKCWTFLSDKMLAKMSDKNVGLFCIKFEVSGGSDRHGKMSDKNVGQK